jgi:hypothetical protein
MVNAVFAGCMSWDLDRVGVRQKKTAQARIFRAQRPPAIRVNSAVSRYCSARHPMRMSAASGHPLCE